MKAAAEAAIKPKGYIFVTQKVKFSNFFCKQHLHYLFIYLLLI